MNEVTRIHLAKVAYDIDVVAKKHLEHYMKELEEYTGSSDVLTDVEIRMTELLAERHVLAGGVIANDDVKAMRAQLGEPYEFADEDGDIAVGSVDEHVHPRRFFRDLHGAVLGGVLSGIALYFNVEVLWIRLAFAVVTVMTSGVAIIGYLLLWAIVPPARTATERLHQMGKRANVTAIRALKSTNDLSPSSTAPVVMRVITVLLGILSAIFALSILAFVIMMTLGLTGPHFDALFAVYGADSVISWVVAGVAVLGFLLLSALFALTAYALFAQKLTKRMVWSAVVIIVLGITLSVAVAGTMAVQSWRMQTEAQHLLKRSSVELPASFAGVTSLVVEQGVVATNGQHIPMGISSTIHYVVSASKPHYELVALPGARLHVSLTGTTVTLSVDLPKDIRNSLVQSDITVFGPALQSISARGVSTDYSNTSQQSRLAIDAQDNASVSVTATVDAANLSGDSTIDLSSSSIEALTIQAKNGLQVQAGTVRNLTANLPDVCPSQNGMTNVSITGVTDGSITYNGEHRNAASYQTNCAELIIGDPNAGNF